MMATAKPFTYLIGETYPSPISGFRKPNEIIGTADARPIGSGGIPGEEGILTERPNPEIQNSELPHRDITSAYNRSFEAGLHLQTDSEYERNQQTANSSNNRLKSAKTPHEKTLPAVPPKRTNDQTEQYPTDRSATDYITVGGVARERLNGGQSKEGPNPDDSDNDEHRYGQVKRHNDSKTERDDVTPRRPPYEIPHAFSYTDPIRPAAPPLHGEKQSTSVDENRPMEFEDVVIDDFSDLCSSLSSIADIDRDHYPPVVPSKAESHKEEFTSDDQTNSRKVPMPPNSMVAAKPFTYLTGEIPSSKSEFLRSGEIVGTSSTEVSAGPQPIRNPSTREKDADLTRRMVPKVPYNGDGISAYQPVDVALYPKTDYAEQKTASDDAINQLKTNDLQNQLKTHMKKVPIVLPKRANDQAELTAEDVSSGFLLFTSKESLYGDDRLKKDGQGSYNNSDNSENLLYGQVKRHVRDVKTDKDSTPSSVSQEIPPPPFSYTEPIRPTAPLHGEKQTHPNDKVKNLEFQGGAVDDFDDLCPSSSPPTDVQTLFDNFILVKATNNKPEITREKEFISKQPKKRLKLEELFDPPPPPLVDPRKVSILGVTSTESSDFHVDYKSKIANGSNYDRTKGPVSTFDNPDYNISSNYTIESRTNVHTVADFRSESNRSLVASNSTDKTSETPVKQVSTRRRRCDSGLCIAILVTALVTSVICLGAGFVAGWFGRGMRDFGQP